MCSRFWSLASGFCRANAISLHWENGASFRAEFFNIFIHPNFGQPDNVLSDPFFGQSAQMLARFLGSGGANGGFNPSTKSAAPAPSSLPPT
jgi:hypothetical protein